ncbi:MAG: zinc metallopeptidase [Planctomycetota bacterium]
MFTLFDPMYWLIVGPTMLVALWASFRVKSTFLRFSNVGVRSGMTGAQAAAAVARAGGAEVTVELHQGFLSDHYDPRTRSLHLSPEVYNGRSVSSIAVAAHEAGHAIQHAQGYKWLTFRSNMVPVVSIGSQVWIWVFLAGLMLPKYGWLLELGILIFGVTVVFQLITLPVEFDASNRAKAVLASSGIVSTPDEARGVSKVLGAAAMTYVAGALTAIATLIYYLMLANRRND